MTATELTGFAGMTMGGIFIGVWGGFKSQIKTFAAGLFILSIMIIGMGISPAFILYLVLMFFYSIALVLVQTATTTMIQEQAKESVKGRVFGLMGTMYSGFLPIGMAFFGPLADNISLQKIMIATGLSLGIIAIFLSRSKSE